MGNFGVLISVRSLSISIVLSCASTTSLLILSSVISTADAAQLTYSPAIEARVIDPSGVPIVDVIIVANWNIVGFWNGASRGQLAFFEVRTDYDGKFNIPSWGPRFASNGIVTAIDPTLRLFKPGYRPRVIYNVEGFEQFASAPSIIRFRMQGQDIMLTPADGSDNAADEKAIKELYRSTDVLCGSMPPPCKLREDLSNRAR